MDLLKLLKLELAKLHIHNWMLCKECNITNTVIEIKIFKCATCGLKGISYGKYFNSDASGIIDLNNLSKSHEWIISNQLHGYCCKRCKIYGLSCEDGIVPVNPYTCNEHIAKKLID